MQTKVTPGGLIDGRRRLSEILVAWYEQITEEAKNSTHLHADETGWRINGQGCWLWCFTNDRNGYYMIEYCRGSPVLQNSQSNRSGRGAATQAVLMSVYRTLKLRGLDPTRSIVDALKSYLTSAQLPPLPEGDIANG